MGNKSDQLKHEKLRDVKRDSKPTEAEADRKKREADKSNPYPHKLRD